MKVAGCAGIRNTGIRTVVRGARRTEPAAEAEEQVTKWLLGFVVLVFGIVVIVVSTSGGGYCSGDDKTGARRGR